LINEIEGGGEFGVTSEFEEMFGVGCSSGRGVAGPAGGTRSSMGDVRKLILLKTQSLNGL
jgi:hypothetical protein